MSSSIHEPDQMDQEYDAFFANLTPCPSTLTVQDFIPTQLGSPENTPVKNLMITMVHPDLTHRTCFPLSDVVSYVQASNQSLAPEDITVYHLILYFFFEKLCFLDDIAADIKHINQLKFITMGKSYRLGNVVDLSFPPCFLNKFSLLTILSASSVFQVTTIPKSSVVPFTISAKEIDAKLEKIIHHSDQTAEDQLPSGSLKNQLKRVRTSLSSASSRKQSVSSVESATSSLMRSRSTSIPTRSISNGSETEIDEISTPTSLIKPAQSRPRSRIRSHLRRIFH